MTPNHAPPLHCARIWLTLGALNGFLAVALGAFAAHGLKGRLPANLLEVFEKAVDYQALHGLALLLTGLLCAQAREGRWLRTAGAAFFAGILLFSGSLYALALTGARTWGMVTPFGGTAFLLGWAALAMGGWRMRAPQ